MMEVKRVLGDDKDSENSVLGQLHMFIMVPATMTYVQLPKPQSSFFIRQAYVTNGTSIYLHTSYSPVGVPNGLFVVPFLHV